MISSDHLSPKISRAVLIGHSDRYSIFFLFTPQIYKTTCKLKVNIFIFTYNPKVTFVYE